MVRKKVYNTANVLLFLVGLFFVIGSKATITGSVAGVHDTFIELRTTVGLFLIVCAGVMFAYSKHG